MQGIDPLLLALLEQLVVGLDFGQLGIAKVFDLAIAFGHHIGVTRHEFWVLQQVFAHALFVHAHQYTNVPVKTSVAGPVINTDSPSFQ